MHMASITITLTLTLLILTLTLSTETVESLSLFTACCYSHLSALGRNWQASALVEATSLADAFLYRRTRKSYCNLNELNNDDDTLKLTTSVSTFWNGQCMMHCILSTVAWPLCYLCCGRSMFCTDCSPILLLLCNYFNTNYVSQFFPVHQKIPCRWWWL